MLIFIYTSTLSVDAPHPSGHGTTHALFSVVCSGKLAWQKMHNPVIDEMIRAGEKTAFKC
jgi:hypothetical protein